ncbi:hypothetical protein Pint_31919 [Pistacia integerrima]|uniref:Uncharacterized protein n=1 Tax=Pistacia integerrima TaxID=434235 RepID=A0ACC0XNL0_9ROSI|nr:hypothetical protein Pint_31919 [Pistacia integerrima]
MDLDDSYSQIRGQILLNDPLPLLSKVYALIVQEERQQDISSTGPIVDLVALLSRANAGQHKPQQRNVRKLIVHIVEGITILLTSVFYYTVTL